MLLSKSALADLGFRSLGENVAIDASVAIFGAEHIAIGDNVRIDCFCVLSAGPSDIVIGRNVHVAAGAQLFGGGGITLADFSGISGRVSIYSVNDDYSDGYLTNPTVPSQYRQVRSAPVTISRHALVGAGSVILPGATLGTGASVGALSLVNKSVPEYTVVAGNPLRRVGTRNGERLAELEAAYLNEGAS